MLRYDPDVYVKILLAVNVKYCSSLHTFACTKLYLIENVHKNIFWNIHPWK